MIGCLLLRHSFLATLSTGLLPALVVLLGTQLCAVGRLHSEERSPQTETEKSDSASPGQTSDGSWDVVLVRGAEGQPEFGEQFDQWLNDWRQATRAWNARLLEIGRTPQGGSSADSISPPSDRERLRLALREMPHEGDAPVWLVLFGHGTYAQSPEVTAKFNLEGPDLSADELGEWLRPFSRPVIVINASSCSGPFVNSLSAPGRIVVTATRSGHEQSFARFGGFLARAILDPSCDRDHDGAVSLLEAYLAASHRVEQFYQENERLATEHALLEDTGDRQGVTIAAFDGIRPKKPATEEGRPIDGALAHRWQVLQVEPQLDLTSEQMQRRDEIEGELSKLRAGKSLLDEQEYYQRLEPLLVELARLMNAGDDRVGL